MRTLATGFRAAFGVLALLCSSWSCSASADAAGPAPDQASAYEAAVAHAFAEFELQNYAEAQTMFLEAHRINPNARTLRALGMVEFELKSYVQSTEYLELALRSDVRPLTDAQRAQTESLLKRARAFVGRYTLSLKPEHASLSLDGETLSLQAGPNTLSLPVGEHLLEAQAEGFRPYQHRLQVVGGQAETIAIALKPSAHADDGRPADRASATPVYKKWWLWTTVGLVIAGGVAAAVILTHEPEPKSPSRGSTDEVVYLLRWGR